MLRQVFLLCCFVTFLVSFSNSCSDLVLLRVFVVLGQFGDPFGAHFGAFFVVFLLFFTKGYPPLILNNPPMVLHGFWAPDLPNSDPETLKRHIKILSKISYENTSKNQENTKFWAPFGAQIRVKLGFLVPDPHLGWFGEHFGSILGAFWEPLGSIFIAFVVNVGCVF